MQVTPGAPGEKKIYGKRERQTGRQKKRNRQTETDKLTDRETNKVT